MGIILVIENDPTIVKALQHLFTPERYELRRAENGKQGLNVFSSTPPDAVILALMLPDISGREICRQMKQNSPDIPVIILSVISNVAEKVLLLELGADDYITKPFSPRELLARVQAAIRRSKHQMPEDCVTFANIQLNFASMCGGTSEFRLHEASTAKS